MFDLTGKVALVTGAGQNVGAEIARVLAQQGAAVAVNDLFADRAELVATEIREAGGQAMAAAADVTDLDGLRQQFAAVASDLGPIDVLVNNAGVPPNPDWTMVPFHTTDPAAWRLWVDINMYGVFNTCHLALGPMVERGWGRVINIVSDGGRIGEAGLAVYCGAKALSLIHIYEPTRPY